MPEELSLVDDPPHPPARAPFLLDRLSIPFPAHNLCPCIFVVERRMASVYIVVEPIYLDYNYSVYKVCIDLREARGVD